MTAIKHEERRQDDAIKNSADLTRIYAQIQTDVERAMDRPTLSELHKRANYLVTLTYTPSWMKRFGHHAMDLREAAHREYSKTAQAINRRARKIGTAADYDEQWGEAGGK
jgi:hypothetical protein